jgi:hypothetical protein
MYQKNIYVTRISDALHLTPDAIVIVKVNDNMQSWDINLSSWSQYCMKGLYFSTISDKKIRFK